MKNYSQQFRILILIFFMGLSATPSAQDKVGISLEQATKNIKTESNGKILSAKTTYKNGKNIHQIRVLTPSGRIKDYRVPVYSKLSNNKQKRPNPQFNIYNNRSSNNSSAQRNYKYNDNNKNSYQPQRKNNSATTKNSMKPQTKRYSAPKVNNIKPSQSNSNKKKSANGDKK